MIKSLHTKMTNLGELIESNTQQVVSFKVLYIYLRKGRNFHDVLISTIPTINENFN